MRVVFDPIAEMQLADLYEYISQSSGYEERAEGYINRILSFCLALATFPERGTQRNDIRPGLRSVGFEGRVTITFIVRDSFVVILGIFYGGQNIEAFFSNE